MATVASIVTNLRANTGQFDRALDGAKNRTRAFAKDATSSLDTLKHSFGGRSDLKDIVEIGRGSGPIIALTAISGALLETAKSAAELRKQMVSGELTTEQYKSRLVELIPVLGNFAKAGREIGESLATAFDPEVLNNLKVLEKLNTQGSARGAALKGLMDFQNQTDQNKLGPVGKQVFAATKEINALRDAAIKNAGGMNPASIMASFSKSLQERLAQIFETEQVNRATENWKDRIQTVANTLDHWFDGLQSQKKKFDADAAATKARRDSFVSGARGIFDRLKDQESAGPQFAGAIIKGSQEEFAARQRSLFGNSIARKDERELAREAVELQKKEIDETKQTNDLLKELATQMGIADFN